MSVLEHFANRHRKANCAEPIQKSDFAGIWYVNTKYPRGFKNSETRFFLRFCMEFFSRFLSGADFAVYRKSKTCCISADFQVSRMPIEASV